MPTQSVFVAASQLYLSECLSHHRILLVMQAASFICEYVCDVVTTELQGKLMSMTVALL